MCGGHSSAATYLVGRCIWICNALTADKVVLNTTSTRCLDDSNTMLSVTIYLLLAAGFTHLRRVWNSALPK